MRPGIGYRGMGEVVEFSGRRSGEDEEVDLLARRVIAIVAHQTGRPAERIGLDTEIERELGCTGDDAWMLLGRLAAEFGIDMSGMEFDRHFGDEGGLAWPVAVALVVAVLVAFLSMHLLGFVARLAGLGWLLATDPRWLFAIVYVVSALAILAGMTLLPQARLRRARLTPITIRDLVQAARTRRWMIDVTEKKVP